jgi:hypothetical protein
VAPVILIGLAVVVLGTYVPLMLHASGGRRGAAFLGALEGLLFAAGTGLASLAALFWLGLKCDEACDKDPPETRTDEWWRTLDAWQWEAQAAFAFGAFAAALATIVLPLVRWYRTGIIAVILGLVAFCAWAWLMAPLGDQFGI